MNKKKDSSILITGSSRGIGAALARVCKQEGFEVILHGRSKSKDLLNLAKELNCEFSNFYFDPMMTDADKKFKQLLYNRNFVLFLLMRSCNVIG